jgi:hypothetical protein
LAARRNSLHLSSSSSRADIPGTARAPRFPQPRRDPTLSAALDKDRRLSRGLLLLFAERALQDEPVFDRINSIGEIHSVRLAAIKGHPAVADVRSIGTMAAIELHADDPGYASELRPKLYKFFIDAGVLLRPLGNIIYILPPYAISAAELNFIHDRVVESLALC